jgi:hypothetical protein
MATNGSNTVTVTVDSNGNPVCTPDQVPAKGPNALLIFNLDAAGYVFPQDNAVVVDNDIDPPQFPDASQTLTPTKAKLLDLNTVRGTFKYTVTVQQVSSGQLFPLDPTILNEL